MMILLIVLCIIYNLSTFSQADCGNFKTLFYEIEKNQSEISQNYLPNFVIINISSTNSIEVELHDVDGKFVFHKGFLANSSGKYVIKFYNDECPGIYFCSIRIGDEPDFKKAIQITKEKAPIKVDTTKNKN